MAIHLLRTACAVLALFATSANAARPTACTKQFVKAWLAWDKKGQMPSPRTPCIMYTSHGHGVYLCNKSGCSGV